MIGDGKRWPVGDYIADAGCGTAVAILLVTAAVCVAWHMLRYAGVIGSDEKGKG